MTAVFYITYQYTLLRLRKLGHSYHVVKKTPGPFLLFLGSRAVYLVSCARRSNVCCPSCCKKTPVLFLLSLGSRAILWL